MRGGQSVLQRLVYGDLKVQKKYLLMRMVFYWVEGVAGGGHCLELKLIYKRYTQGLVMNKTKKCCVRGWCPFDCRMVSYFYK